MARDAGNSGAYNKIVMGTKTFVDLTEDTVEASDLLEGKTAHAANGYTITGTMKNNGDQSATLAAGGSKTIPAGYTSGGTVSAQSLSSQTSGTAVAANILSGKTAWVNGSKVTGSMPDNSTTTSNGTVPGISSSYPSVPTRPAESGLLQYCADTSGTARISMSPPKGYYPGGGSSYVNRPASEFGNATAADVVSGRTFTSASGLKVSGTMNAVLPGDWEVFRDGAFQQSYIGIAPYYYNPSGMLVSGSYGELDDGYVYYKSSYTPLTSLKVQTNTSGTPTINAAVMLSKWIPSAKVSKITVGYTVTAIKSYMPYAFIIPVMKDSGGASKSKWYGFGNTDGAKLVIANSGGSKTGTVTIKPDTIWYDYFNLMFYARRYATLTINSIVLTIK